MKAKVPFITLSSAVQVNLAILVAEILQPKITMSKPHFPKNIHG